MVLIFRDPLVSCLVRVERLFLVDLHVVDQVLESGQRDDIWTQFTIPIEHQKLDQFDACIGVQDLVEIASARMMSS